jgi:hypothetical protein
VEADAAALFVFIKALSVKKIGILYGQENTFPQAFIARVNRHCGAGLMAEPVQISKALQGGPPEYAVVIDRISHDVPFYRAWLKNAALQGSAVINNPFWWSADEKFFNNAIALHTGVPVPATALLPSFELPDDTTGNSFRNLSYPLDWEAIFAETGFPAYMKPFAGGGWKNVYRIKDREEFFEVHAQTGRHVMLLQEEIVFQSYFRCYCIGGKYVHIMPYEPRNTPDKRYDADFLPDERLKNAITQYTLMLNQALGYDFNTVEFAVREGVPYAIDFCNPAPDADLHSVGEANFEWVVEHAARYAIERATEQENGKDNLTWGSWLKQAVQQDHK